MEPTADVLAELAAERRPGQLVVGFAAEHGDGAVERARRKLERKALDAVVVNDISRRDIGFDVEENEVTLVTRGGAEAVPRGSKAEVAAAILDAVERLRSERAETAR
jgi:phosphopantothenoylcysteine decarboxylase/phosphopantothenate--cysteine ligase